MKNQYLIVAENITYKHNKLSCINIYDQFVSVQLPAEFVFDLAVLCGPGWDVGSHDIEIKIRINENELLNVGDIKIEIPGKNFVYNAIAPNLKVALGEGLSSLKFEIYKNNELIIEREYPINTLINRTRPEQQAETPLQEAAQ